MGGQSLVQFSYTTDSILLHKQMNGLGGNQVDIYRNFCLFTDSPCAGFAPELFLSRERDSFFLWLGYIYLRKLYLTSILSPVISLL